jgi:anti-sigma B factor antagonist
VKLSIEKRPLGSRQVEIILHGEVDYETAQHLRTAVSSMLDGKIDTIVVNLAGVTFLDSTGIGTLVVARRICHDLGVAVKVREANPFVARLFAVVGVGDVLGVPAPPGEIPARLPQPRETAAGQPV